MLALRLSNRRPQSGGRPTVLWPLLLLWRAANLELALNPLQSTNVSRPLDQVDQSLAERAPVEAKVAQRGEAAPKEHKPALTTFVARLQWPRSWLGNTQAGEQIVLQAGKVAAKVALPSPEALSLLSVPTGQGSDAGRCQRAGLLAKDSEALEESRHKQGRSGGSMRTALCSATPHRR
ncbi:hypothetical protein KTAU_23150 [Thermogemmatispora aurantia]|uniref:Uncharacterized protein n=1 Tax=Thermogemmatispora aurantia TaxID=2045279 RepID=A0A5J4K4M7_9CHLR|nr:hypothetical protein KTAU_23150 [Thermogemmatispora aurantia]